MVTSRLYILLLDRSKALALLSCFPGEVGGSLPEVQATHLARTSLRLSTIQMASHSSPGRSICYKNLAPNMFLQGPPVGDGGVQLVAWQECGDHFLCAKLLLPLRQPGCHHGARWRPQVFLPSVWPSPKAWGTSCDSANTRLLLVKATLQRTPLII